VQRHVGLVRFAVVFTGMMIVMAIISAFLEIFAGIDISGSVNQIVAVVIASMDSGNRFYTRYETVPDSGFAWQAAFQMTLVECAISIVLFGAVLLLLMPTGELAASLEPFMLFAVPLLILVFAISLVLKRFMFVSGARSAEKAHLKKLQKSSAAFE